MKKIQAALKHTLLTAGLASTVTLSASAQQANEDARPNPLLVYSDLTFKAPKFDWIEETDYQPALLEAISCFKKA